MTTDDGGADRAGPATPPPAPPHRVRVPVNVHHWDGISFLHWPFDPTEVARLLPEGLSVLTRDGQAWVGVTPFFIRVRPLAAPVPPGWAFPETNVRTYVLGPGGRQGLWFLWMEVTASWFVATLRSIGLPYHRQRMSVDVSDGRVEYTSRPLRPSSGGGHRIIVRPGEALDPPEGGPLEHFLTARWGAFHQRGSLLYTPVEHPPWTLHNADAETCEVHGLFRSSGLSTPLGAPLAHYSPGVRTRVGWPRPV